VIRLFVNKSLDILSFIKTYPSDMEEKLSLKTSIYTPKRFHLIHCQKRIGLTSTNLSNTHFKGGINIRTISTSSSEFESVVIYTNPDEHKGLIAKQNKGKSGVYRWVHKGSGKSYVGSSTMLNDRFRRYFNHSYLSSNKRGASLICKALLKYGYAGFRLEILEYCPSLIVLDREQFYIDKLNPEYNILKIAGSNLGYKHSEASLKLMSDASKSRNESEEVLKFKREIMLDRKLSEDHLEKMAQNNPFRVPIILSNIETGKNKEFTSLIQAALFLGVHMTTVKRYLVNNKPYKGYTITKATSSLDSSCASSLTNSKQAVELTNSVTGITKQFSTMKAAYQFLGISPRRLLNYLKNNKSTAPFTNGQVSTIKGYIISKIDSDSVKQNCKTIEVTNIQTNEVINYYSISSAGEALGIPQSSISVYLSRKRNTPFRGIYLFKLV
jgi:group I intron endonuclease